MAAPRGRAQSKKDKWKSKNWYSIKAPDMFNRAKIAEALSDEPEKLIGRTTEVTVQDITGDFSKMHIKVKLKIFDVRGMDAYTVFVGHDMTSDYVRRMTRRKRTKTDVIIDVYTRDEYLIRLKPLIISERRIKSSQQSAIREIVLKTIEKYAGTRTISEVVKGIISGEMGKVTAVACKVIQPSQRVEIRKSDVLQTGKIEHVYEDEHEGEEEDSFAGEEPTEALAEPVEEPAVEEAAEEEPPEEPGEEAVEEPSEDAEEPAEESSEEEKPDE